MPQKSWIPDLKPPEQTYTDWYRPRWDLPFDTEKRLHDPLWRINNLYSIVDANGQKIRFIMREGMFKAFAHQWWKNVLLKSRQYGYTTWVCILTLDECIFVKNWRAAIVAHSKDDAQVFFRDKIVYAYENLCDFAQDYVYPDGRQIAIEPHGGLTFEQWQLIGEDIKATVAKVKQTTEELYFTNHSSVRVTTSGRSGTLNRAHVSELGKIAAKFPEKAEEIKTGTIPATKTGTIWIESTAEGHEGYFKETVEKAMLMERQGRRLTREDYQFHFHPWWEDTDYRMDPANVIISDRLLKYFRELEQDHGVPPLSDEQKAWYAKVEANLGEAMWREHPSYPEEAFKASIGGTFLAKQMRRARTEGRIGQFPVIDGIAVDTYWDIGLDMTCCWFVQRQGVWFTHVDYWYMENAEFIEAIKMMRAKREDYEWQYGVHHGPNDIKDRAGTVTKASAWHIAREHGFLFRQGMKISNIEDAIRTTQIHLQLCRFDEENCLHGITGLEMYRQKYDETLGKYTGVPVHDAASHPASAMHVESIAAQPGKFKTPPRSGQQQPRRRRNFAYA